MKPVSKDICSVVRIILYRGINVAIADGPAAFTCSFIFEDKILPPTLYTIYKNLRAIEVSV